MARELNGLNALMKVDSRVLARDQSASREDWHKLARTGEIVWFYNGRDRNKTGKMLRNCHFGRTVSESWLNPWWTAAMARELNGLNALMKVDSSDGRGAKRPECHHEG